MWTAIFGCKGKKPRPEPIYRTDALSGLSTLGWDNGTHPQLQMRNILTEGRVWVRMSLIDLSPERVNRLWTRNAIQSAHTNVTAPRNWSEIWRNFFQKYSVHNWGGPHSSYWIRSKSILECLHLRDCSLTQSKINSIFPREMLLIFCKEVITMP